VLYRLDFEKNLLPVEEPVIEDARGHAKACHERSIDVTTMTTMVMQTMGRLPWVMLKLKAPYILANHILKFSTTFPVYFLGQAYTRDIGQTDVSAIAYPLTVTLLRCMSHAA